MQAIEQNQTTSEVGINVQNEAQLASSTLIGYRAALLLKSGQVNVSPSDTSSPKASPQAALSVSPGTSPSATPSVKPSPKVTPSPTPAQGQVLTPDQILEGLRFQRGVFVQPGRQSGTLLTVRVDDADPKLAAEKASALSGAYLGFKRDQLVAVLAAARGQIQAKVATVTDAIAAIEASGERTQDLQGLNQNLANLQLNLDNINDSITKSRTAGDVINPPLPPSKPTRPNHVRDGVFAFIVGLLLGVGAAFLRDYVDDSLKGTEDVERQSGAPLIGVVPHVAAVRASATANGKKTYLVTRDDPKAPASEAYRTLRTNLLFMSVSGPVGRLLITSPMAGEGKTTTAANLAVVLAQAGQRVLLVGSDLRRPSIHRYFGSSNRVGLSSVLAGQASLPEAVSDPGIKGLRIMSGGPVPPNPTELLGSLAMKEFLDQAGQVTDWVLLDAPPVLGLADAAVLATLSDAALMIVNETTNRRVLAHARDQLAKVRARVVGTVLNNFGPAFTYYYSDYYAYTSQYYLQEPELEPTNGELSRRDRRRAERARQASGRVSEQDTQAIGPPEERIPL